MEELLRRPRRREGVAAAVRDGGLAVEVVREAEVRLVQELVGGTCKERWKKTDDTSIRLVGA